MATLKQLLAEYSNSTSLDFRINDNSAIDGTLWAYAWVKDKKGKLLCIGTTLETLQKKLTLVGHICPSSGVKTEKTAKANDAEN
jgi:hypothetical protein